MANPVTREQAIEALHQTVAIIGTLDPAIRDAAWRLVGTAWQSGIPLVVISGLRSPAQNLEAGGAPQSLHLQGLAFDVAVLGYRRDELPLAWWQQVGEWAEAYLGLRWGGRFTHAGSPDVNHFDARTWLT